MGSREFASLKGRRCQGVAQQSLHRRSEAPYLGAPEEPWDRHCSPGEVSVFRSCNRMWQVHLGCCRFETARSDIPILRFGTGSLNRFYVLCMLAQA